MAPQAPAQDVVVLRLVTQRLSSTHTNHLPHITPHLARMISGCGSFLSVQPSVLTSDVAVLVHKLKTQISSLLQDGSIQARWVAVILVKATIAAGGYEVLQGVASWARSLITMIGKSDPPSTKKLCIATLTRIFQLTHGHQSLVREITTPVLPAFTSACLKVLSSKDDPKLVSVVLQALVELLPHHPASFRPFVPQIRNCILPFIAATPSKVDRRASEKARDVTEVVANCSRRLYALLSTCAPKKTEGEEWTKALRLIVESVHLTADSVFRSLVEDRRSHSGNAAQLPNETLRTMDQDSLGLPNWTGIEAGIERLKGLLRTLQAFIATAANFAVAMPLGIVLGVVSRMLSLLAPMDLGQGSARANLDFGRGERETLLYALPSIHEITVEILSCMIERLGFRCASTYASTLQQCLLVLSVDGGDPAVRAAVYKYVKKVVEHFGPSISLRSKEALSHCISSCCDDLLPTKPNNKGGPIELQHTPVNGSSENPAKASNSLSYDHGMRQEQTQIEAEKFLQLSMTNLADTLLAPSSRAQIDRTAVLTQNEVITVASVLNPQTRAESALAQSSILPLMARAFPKSTITEAIIRPRMPLVQISSSHLGATSYIDAENIHDDMQELNYAQIHSGSLKAYNENVAETRSLVEDSMQSERQPGHVSFASVGAEPSISAGVDTQKPELSLLEVPETQPMMLVNSTKRDRYDKSIDKAPETQHDAEEDPSDIAGAPASKKPRIDNREGDHDEDDSAKFNDRGAATGAPTATAPNMPDTITVPIHSVQQSQALDEGSDSDDSSVHLDPTIATEDEDEEDEDEDEDEDDALDT